MDMTVFEAASCGDSVWLSEALDGALGEIPVADLELALLRACDRGNTACVALLRKHGVPVDLRDGQGNGPLILAAQGGHVAIVELLLRAGADVNSTNDWGCSPIMKASEGYRPGVVKILLNHHAILCTEQLACKLDYRPDRTDHDLRGDSSLNWAVKADNIEIVRSLLASNACVFDLDSGKCTALHNAAKYASTQVVEMLLAAGADISARNLWGTTPLMAAVSAGKQPVVQMLIDRGADLSIVCKMKRTCLSIAARACAEKTINSILEAGGDPDHRDGHGNYPLSIAIAHHNHPAVKALIRGNCRLDISCRDIPTWTIMSVFYLAAWKKDLETMEILYQAGACDMAVLSECVNSEALREECSDVPELFERLKHYMSQPNSLASMCRLAIRSCMRPPDIHTVMSLSLPTFLKAYLLFND